MKKLILVFLCISNAYALNPSSKELQELIYFQKVYIDEVPSTVIVEKYQGGSLFQYFGTDNKLKFKFEMGSIETLDNVVVESINNYDNDLILSVWDKGVHGKQLYIHDQKTGKELLHIKSSFLIDIENDDDSLIIEWADGVDKKRNPKIKKTKFPKS